MNWKKLGYKPKDKVCIVSRVVFSEEKTFLEGEVVHAGTKVLKVKLSDDETLSFEKRYAGGRLAGLYYEVYKSKEEYEEIIKKKAHKKLLKEDIINKITHLSVEQLEEIEKLINSFNKDGSDE